MCGLPGSGKTTIAGILASALAAPVSCFDGYYRSRCHPELAPEDLLSSWIEEAVASASDQSALILDATFYTRTRRATLYRLAGQLGLPLVLVNLDAPAEVLLDRLERQRRDGSKVFHSETPSEILRHYLHAYESPLVDTDAPPIIRMDTMGGSCTTYCRSDHSLLDRLEHLLGSIAHDIRSGGGGDLRTRAATKARSD
jgi:tRNA uridine 5-carbamoylmethylation protein Kti12